MKAPDEDTCARRWKEMASFFKPFFRRRHGEHRSADRQPPFRAVPGLNELQVTERLLILYVMSGRVSRAYVAVVD